MSRVGGQLNRFEDMKIFVETVNRGNFSATAEYMGLSKQYVSRRIAALESRLGVRLLNRTTRRLSPTSLGLNYFEKVSLIIKEAEDIDNTISTYSNIPKGKLKITAPVSYGLLYLPQIISSFMENCAEVSVELDIDDRYTDLIREGYDLGIRIGTSLPDSSLIARKLASIHFITVASPIYLALHGTPKTPEELQHHECLLCGHATVKWNYIKIRKKFLYL